MDTDGPRLEQAGSSMGGGVDMNGPGLGSLMLSGFSVLLLSPAADPVEPETVTLPATVELGMKVAP